LTDTDGVGVWPNVSSWMRDESRSGFLSPATLFRLFINDVAVSNLLNKLVQRMPLNITLQNRIVNAWNSLSCHTVSSPTLSTFEAQLQNWIFTFHLIGEIKIVLII